MAMPKVCIVDDEIEITELCANMLGRGYCSSCFGSARQALHDFSHAGVPDVVITDLKMPEMDGAEFIRQMKALKMRSPVVVITGYPELAEEIQAESQGVVAVLSKPFTPAQLREAVGRAVEVAEIQAMTEQMVAALSQCMVSGNQAVMLERKKREIAHALFYGKDAAFLTDPAQVVPHLRGATSFEEKVAIAMRARAAVSELLRLRRKLMKR